MFYAATKAGCGSVKRRGGRYGEKLEYISVLCTWATSLLLSIIIIIIIISRPFNSECLHVLYITLHYTRVA